MFQNTIRDNASLKTLQSRCTHCPKLNSIIRDSMDQKLTKNDNNKTQFRTFFFYYFENVNSRRVVAVCDHYYQQNTGRDAKRCKPLGLNFEPVQVSVPFQPEHNTIANIKTNSAHIEAIPPVKSSLLCTTVPSFYTLLAYCF